MHVTTVTCLQGGSWKAACAFEKIHNTVYLHRGMQYDDTHNARIFIFGHSVSLQSLCPPISYTCWRAFVDKHFTLSFVFFASSINIPFCLFCSATMCVLRIQSWLLPVASWGPIVAGYRLQSARTGVQAAFSLLKVKSTIKMNDYFKVKHCSCIMLLEWHDKNHTSHFLCFLTALKVSIILYLSLRSFPSLCVW